MEKKEKPVEKAFFFVRHNNDIDHMVPVIYKWAETHKIPTDVIIITKREHLKDHRIDLLKKFGHVRIFHIKDLFNKNQLPYIFSHFYFKDDTRFDGYFKKVKILRKIADDAIIRIADKLYKDVNKGFVAFDWITTYFTKKMIQIANNRGLTTISLPHGDRVYTSQLETINDLNYDCLISHYEPSKIFKYVVVPNEISTLRYDRFMEKNRIKALGSPRYNEEWRNIIKDKIPNYNVKGAEGKLKIVFFLRNRGFPIFWEEIIRSMRLILQFPEVYLVVVHHPRNFAAKKLTSKFFDFYPELRQNVDKNLKFIYGDVNSISLINWADVIIELGTSITWEAIKQGKPVLMLEYLNANYGIISHYNKTSEMKSRDDLYYNIEEFIKNKNRKFYDDEGRRKFIKDMIDFPDEKVLERYTKFLKECLNESTKKQT